MPRGEKEKDENCTLGNRLGKRGDNEVKRGDQERKESRGKKMGGGQRDMRKTLEEREIESRDKGVKKS